jgi:hypothetical protein
MRPPLRTLVPLAAALALAACSQDEFTGPGFPGHGRTGSSGGGSSTSSSGTGGSSGAGSSGSRAGSSSSGASGGDAGAWTPPPPPQTPQPGGFQLTIAPLLDAQGCTECHHHGRPIDLSTYPFMAGSATDAATLLAASFRKDMPPAPRAAAPQSVVDQVNAWIAAGMSP